VRHILLLTKQPVICIIAVVFAGQKCVRREGGNNNICVSSNSEYNTPTQKLLPVSKFGHCVQWIIVWCCVTYCFLFLEYQVKLWSIIKGAKTDASGPLSGLGVQRKYVWIALSFQAKHTNIVCGFVYLKLQSGHGPCTCTTAVSNHHTKTLVPSHFI